MILAFDTYYFDNKAKTVCLCFEQWTDDKPAQVFEEIVEGIAEYEPGAFYKRELPCILSLLNKIDLTCVDWIVVDGYVILNDTGKIGLGGYLYEQLDKKVPVIGVAKSNYVQNTKNKLAILRGESVNPLFITALGVSLEKAGEYIKNMHGEFRLPTLLKQLDRLTKE